MTVKVEVIDRFKSTFNIRNGHTKECYICGKNLQNGDQVEGRKIKTTKHYPVKGLMGFVKWQFRHIECEER